MDFAMPFIIQTFREYNDKLNGIIAKMEAVEKEKQDAEEAAKKAAEQGQGQGVDPSFLYNPMNPPMLAITAPGYGMPANPYAMGGGGQMNGYNGY